jgi:excisionase family DNA binding protein
MTAREVSEVVGVAPATVLRWTRQGDLPAVRLPSGAIRYVPEEFEGWLAARATASPVAVVSVRDDRPRLAAVQPREET